MVETHYRWDFIGLSTDTKPTPETSEKVVDGSTFYCSDNSKLYVWCKNQWYEKEVSGGGGGTTYTAGDGIDITDDTISVDTTVIQEKLTAGTGIDITDNTISATGGGIKVLTSSDYNFPESNPDGISLWTLEEGEYLLDGTLKIYTTQGGSKSWYNGSYINILIKGKVSLHYDADSDRWSNIYMTTSGSYFNENKFMYGNGNIVQTTGNSTGNVMSQDATSGMVYNSGDKTQIQIGQNAHSATMAVAIGGTTLSSLATEASTAQAIAIGIGSKATARSTISFGGLADTQGLMNVGTQGSANGYNNTNYRLITGVHDGQDAHDAVTVGQINNLIDAINTTTGSNISHIGA